MTTAHSGPWGMHSPTPFISVLIIDDYALSRIGLRSALDCFRHIYIAGEADNAETGLYLIRQCQPDVVLMDISLPGMDGIEATREIKALYPGIKVLMFTLHGDEETVRAAFDAGADGYCLKSIQVEQLVESLQNVCWGTPFLDTGIDCLQLEHGPGRLPPRLVSRCGQQPVESHFILKSSM